MTHNKLLDRDPSVMITSNQNELKVYQDNIVYLNNGDNFELRFFNPLQIKIGIEINFNGIRKGDGYLVLNPGQDLSLDRFLDEQRKMVFETYSINGNSKEAREAIEKNGKISFNFYRESNWYNSYKKINVNYDFPPKPKKYNYPTYTYGSSRGVKYSSTITLDGMMDTTKSNNVFMSTSSMDMNDIENISTFESSGAFSNEKDISELETGRIEKGEHSNQSFRDVNIKFESVPFYTVEYQLMPHSAKHREIKEVRQYCNICNYRLRNKKWRYCPKCGNKLD